ncbi:hypothetical protein HYH03_006959 [Edaphochlamys debaryana]|uniref:ABC-2 type transporter transmembrane domain-containing protein n=1 Tax=Edaphochlamys debaryana TaxID=47281 RepID=A0A836C0L8_9CHLO|nr:hypothetical protein HYH03_006959 [Edaphochlamys debaryana]|eukprot:KAG2495027.1 hypothetical protein HYH03_006959 [Edaphochlamys debaryana]
MGEPSGPEGYRRPAEVPGKVLGDACARLQGPHASWDPAAVDTLLSVLTDDCIGISCRAPEDKEGFFKFLRIADELAAYGAADPRVAEILDPTYVVLDPTTGLGTPQQLVVPQIPQPYPPLPGGHSIQPQQVARMPVHRQRRPRVGRATFIRFGGGAWLLVQPPLVGFQAVASKFFIFMAFMLLCSTAATRLALAVSAVARTTDMAVTILPMALEISRLFGGFFLSPRNLPNYFVWLDALSYVKYTYVVISLNELDGPTCVGISLNELNGLELTCTPQQERPDGSCAVPDGQTTIDALGLDYITIGDCVGILIGYIVICRIIAYLGVRFLKHQGAAPGA